MEPPNKPKKIDPYDPLVSLNRVLYAAPSQTTNALGRVWKTFAVEAPELAIVQQIVRDAFSRFDHHQRIPIWRPDSPYLEELVKLTDHVMRIYDPSPAKTKLLEQLNTLRETYFCTWEFTTAELLLNQIEHCLPKDHFKPFLRDDAGRIIRPGKELHDYRTTLMACLAPDNWNPHNQNLRYPEHNEILNTSFSNDEITLEKYIAATKAALSRAPHNLTWDNHLKTRGLILPNLLPFNLIQLSIHVNSGWLTYFPEALSKMTSLQEFTLWGGTIRVFPTFLTKLPAIKKVDFESTQPDLHEVKSLTQINSLSVGLRTHIAREANFPVLPEAICQLDQLESLYLANANLSLVMPSIAVFSSLSSLRLVNANLTVLPPQIGTLHRLVYLDCRGNRLRTLPEEIGALEWLEELRFDRNSSLISLPMSLGNLVSLKALLCDTAHLPLLPLTLEQCSKLDAVWHHLQTIWVRDHEGQPTLEDFLKKHHKKPPIEKLP